MTPLYTTYIYNVTFINGRLCEWFGNNVTQIQYDKILNQLLTVSTAVKQNICKQTEGENRFNKNV